MKGQWSCIFIFFIFLIDKDITLLAERVGSRSASTLYDVPYIRGDPDGLRFHSQNRHNQFSHTLRGSYHVWVSYQEAR